LHIAQDEFENVLKVTKEDTEIETLCNEVFVSARVHEDFDLGIDVDELLNVTNEVDIDASVADTSSDLNGVHLQNSEIGKLNGNTNTK
jgi:DNA polymerase III sliding clamp (beta) subunit (PCNA family)